MRWPVRLNGTVDVRDLEAFVAVGEELHFGRAAERLHVVAAAISQRIRSLEAELGLVLFDRTSRTVSLTVGGAALLDPARAALAGIDEVAGLARSLAEGSDGRVALGFAPNAGSFSARVVAAIADAHPNLEIAGHSLWGSEALGALNAGTIEAAVVRDLAAGPAYESVALGRYRDDHVALTAEDPLAGQERLSLSDLDDRPVLVVERRLAERMHDATLAFFAEHAVVPRWRYHGVQDYSQLMTLVAGGQGASLVHSHMAAVPFEGVTVLELAEPGPEYEMRLLWRADASSAVVQTLRKLHPG